jgi:hypothetical protein
MSCSCVKRGDRVRLVASGHGKFSNMEIWELIQKHGEGPHLITGVGRTCVGIELGFQSVNIPKEWVVPTS